MNLYDNLSMQDRKNLDWILRHRAAPKMILPAWKASLEAKTKKQPRRYHTGFGAILHYGSDTVCN